jgi:hypothetical protein
MNCFNCLLLLAGSPTRPASRRPTGASCRQSTASRHSYTASRHSRQSSASQSTASRHSYKASRHSRQSSASQSSASRPSHTASRPSLASRRDYGLRLEINDTPGDHRPCRRPHPLSLGAPPYDAAREQGQIIVL